MSASVAQPATESTRQDLFQAILDAVKKNRDWIKNEHEKICVEDAIGELPDERVGDLFKELANEFLAEFATAGKDYAQRAKVKHRYRKVLGPRYSCLLLTSVGAGDGPRRVSKIDLAAKLRACVEESLQWHREAVLAEALIYYIDDQSEETLLHECAVVEIGNNVNLEQPMYSFLEDLRNYVQDYGSSVRTKAHLRLIPIHDVANLKSKPLGQPNRLDPKDYDERLTLPREDNEASPSHVKFGDQEQFRQIVRRHLGTSLGLKDDFEVIHYSAGSDSIGETKVRTTAHLYVIFRKPMGKTIALDYTIAMRETLGRLTVDYALERMRNAHQALATRREEERNQYKKFEQRVQELSTKIRDVQIKTDAVMAMVTAPIWTILRNWAKEVHTLSDDNNEEKIFFGNRISVSRQHDWSAEQWAAAGLKLVGFSGEDLPDRINDALEAWRFISSQNLQNSERGIAIPPIWRSLSRLGFPLGPDATRESFEAFQPTAHDVRQCFDASGKIYDQNGFSGLFLLFAVGAQFRPSDEGHATTYEKQLRLDPGLKAQNVLEGLHLLNDILHKKRISRQSSIGILLVENEWIRITFDGAMTGLEVNFTKILQTMTGIKREYGHQHPGFDNKTTSVAVFSALGLGDLDWQKDLSRTEIKDPRVIRKDEQGKEIVRCCILNNGSELQIDYLLRM